VSDYTPPYGHGSPDRGPDPWTAIPHNTDTTREQRRAAAIHAADAVLMAGGTADDLSAYLPMLFTPTELEEMGQ
jgi:hypothetical protein